MNKAAVRRVDTDCYSRISPDEAVEFCIHHLRLAALFFEATPNDKDDQLHEEIGRIVKNQRFPIEEPWVTAAKNFVDRLTITHEAMKSGD